MPRFLVPKRSGEHRAAGIALYRALLSQCRAAPLNHEQRSWLQNVVKNRFRQNKELHGTRLLRLAYQAGYNALDLLDASVAGSTANTTRLVTLLNQTPSHLTRYPQPARPKPNLQKCPSARCLPDSKKLLATRPYPTVSGPRRHVPVLVNANSIPFLRYKKPQPESLSRVLRTKIKQRQRRTDHRNNLMEVSLPMAEREDQWDKIVTGICRLGAIDKDEPTWADGVHEAMAEVLRYVERGKLKVRTMAGEMVTVLDKEVQLAEQERGGRDGIKRETKLLRRAQRLVEE